MSRHMTVIGSFALLNAYYNDFRKDIKDLDFIMSKEFFKVFLENEEVEWKSIAESDINMADSIKLKVKAEKLPLEILFSDGVKSLELIQEQICKNDRYAPIEVLYSLKKAHIHFPIKFDKHISDLMFMRAKLREKKGISLERDLHAVDDLLDTYPALTHLHFKETEKRRGKLRTPKMTQSTEQFFGKSKKFVKSYYVHDNMHLAIAHQNADPIFTSILKDGCEVETDHGLWCQLTLQQKIWCVLEEVYVIALERKILPAIFDSEYSDARLDANPRVAFDWALMRVCTTLCDGFFRDFAVRAYDEIVKQYDPQYVTKFFKNIDKYESANRQNTEE